MASATAKRKATGTKKKGTRSPAKTANPERSATFLESVKAENPDITSDQFAVKFNLPLEEVARHRGFINQYVRDFDPKAAAMRLGYPEDTAGEIGRRFLHYPYSQLYLSEVLNLATLESLVSVGDVVARLKMEMSNPDVATGTGYVNNSGNRINAATALGKALGLFTPKVQPVSPMRPILVVGNVHLESPDNWEQVAKDSQRRLKQSTVIDV